MSSTETPNLAEHQSSTHPSSTEGDSRDEHAVTTPPTTTTKAGPNAGSSQRLVLWIVAAVLISCVIAYFAAPMVHTALNTISTDDAYVNGHVTFLAPRVGGQVVRVLVDDNQRVRKGDVLVELDKEPYQVQLAIKQAAVELAESDLVAARAQVFAHAAEARSNRYSLDHAIESVKNQLAVLRSNVAQLKVEEANYLLTEQDYNRTKPLVEKKVSTQQELDTLIAKREVARNRVNSAKEVIQQTRVSLGLPINEENPLDVPEDLEQNYSLVRQALAQLVNSAAAIGYYPESWSDSPKEALAKFFKQDPQGDLDHIYAQLIASAPAIKQAKAKLEQAHRDLDQAKLNLKYCDVVSEIDGVVTRRNVNPGNNVQAGQSLMAVRSLTEIWIDANFKETQLADLRIGQRVACEVDMYGTRREFEGRITGFTMGTGQTLALLPPQNATGNFVKIVQRLPVRIELTNYKSDEAPLFVGLSVTPYVHYKEPPTGPNAGKFLQASEGP
jgi:membrane fusion protein (multidrug efflux system)